VTFSSDKEILLHLEAERVFGKKHMPINSPEVMSTLVEIGLKYLNLSIDEIGKLYLAKWNNKFKEVDVEILGKKFNPILTSHHENHIGSSFPSGFEDSLIVCADGGSEDGTSKIYLKKGDSVELLEDLDDTPMTGKFFGTLTQMIIWPTVGRAHNTYPGKTMGLAALGVDDKELLDLVHKHWREINKLHFDGCDHLLELFNLSKNYEKPWEDERRRNLALVGQNFWVDSFYKKILSYSDLSKNVSLVGGCALNVVLNTKLLESNAFDNVYISPVSGDPGQSLGAILFHNPKVKCEYPYLGRGYGELDQVPEKLVQDL
jgi:carbamoyltransferase